MTVSCTSGYAYREPAECSPAQFRAWLEQLYHDHGLRLIDLAPDWGTTARHLSNIQRGNGKVPRRLVALMRAEGAFPCPDPSCPAGWDATAPPCGPAHWYWWRAQRDAPPRTIGRPRGQHPCIEPGCGRRRHARGLCRLHDYRQRQAARKGQAA